VSKQKTGLLLVLVLLGSFMLGYCLAGAAKNMHMGREQKPVVNTVQKNIIIEAATPVTYEKEYLRSNKVVISNFEYKQNLIGKNLEEVRAEYSAANGFSVSFSKGTLTIRQKINDWAPEDKNKCRLKVYNNMIAVYKGPDSENDVLQRVTAIRANTLPADVLAMIRGGKYEFDNEAALNDALENMDEYE
jgi:hypothetical protein